MTRFILNIVHLSSVYSGNCKGYQLVTWMQIHTFRIV